MVDTSFEEAAGRANLRHGGFVITSASEQLEGFENDILFRCFLNGHRTNVSMFFILPNVCLVKYCVQVGGRLELCYI